MKDDINSINDISKKYLYQKKEELQEHPLVRKYAEYASTYQNSFPRNFLPWHVQGYKLMAALEVLLVNGEGGNRFGDNIESDPYVAAAIISKSIEKAQGFLWTEKINNIIIKSPPIPHFTISDDLLPYDHCFFCNEKLMAIKWWHTHTNKFEMFPGLWTYLSREKKRILQITALYDPIKENVLFMMDAVNYGLKYPDDFENEHNRASVEQLFKKLAFINSPYTRVEKQRLPRPMRRRIAPTSINKNDKAEHDPITHVVVLRRTANDTDRASPEPQGSIEHRHHWWVSGHYRAQWMPSKKSHKVIWIAPHIKGDLTKPLLEKIYSVSR